MQTTNRYISNDLFHLVGRSHPTNDEANYQILLKVIDSSCVSHPPHNPNYYAHQISFNWDKNIFSEELIVPQITCFCDIPYDSLKIHMKKYGMFGISFSREFLIMNGARPVIYMPLQPSDYRAGWGTIHCESLLRDIEQIYRGFYEHIVSVAENSGTRLLGVKPKSSDEAAVAMDDVFTQQFLAFIKPFNSELPDDDPNNFYLEREWRKFGNLRFVPQNVSRIIVNKNYIDRLKIERPIYTNKIMPAPE